MESGVFQESLELAMSEQQQIASRTRSIIFIVGLVFVLACVLISFLPILVFFGPLAFDRTVSVTNLPLSEIPDRFHPHFSPNAARISGEYSSQTRQCTFTYSCTLEDFKAMIAREDLSLDSNIVHEDGALIAGRNWGPGVVSYEFYPVSETGTVAASAW